MVSVARTYLIASAYRAMALAETAKEERAAGAAAARRAQSRPPDPPSTTYHPRPGTADGDVELVHPEDSYRGRRLDGYA